MFTSCLSGNQRDFFRTGAYPFQRLAEPWGMRGDSPAGTSSSALFIFTTNVKAVASSEHFSRVKPRSIWLTERQIINAQLAYCGSERRKPSQS